MVSETRTVRESATSTFRIPGPMITLRPLFPNVPAAGISNAFGSKKRDGDGWSIFGFLMRFGLFTIGLPVPETSALTIADNGVPDCSVPIAWICQPLAIGERRPGRL